MSTTINNNSNVLLSHKQFRKINVDTNTSDMKLGTGNFTILISLSDLCKQRGFTQGEEYGFDSGSLKVEDVYYNEKENDYSDFLKTDNVSFFPIFTYNKIMLYDHFNMDTKTHFYNTHACYIYKGYVHWLINGISDKPDVHVKAEIFKEYGASDLYILLSRYDNIFTVEVCSFDHKQRMYSQEKDNVGRLRIANQTVDHDINLDLYDTGNLTIGYAERVPNYSYDSYIYKDSLRGTLNNFKIFKGVSKTIRSEFLTEVQEYLNGTLTFINRSNAESWIFPKFETHTNAKKFQLGDNIYHNIDNNIYSVDWLYNRDANLECDIIKFNLIGIKKITDFNNVIMPDQYEDSISDVIFSDDIIDEFKSEIPIIVVDIEEKLDDININFLQEKYVMTGIYSDSFAEIYDMINLKDMTTASVYDISEVFTLYDFFVRSFSGINWSNFDNETYLDLNIKILDALQNLINFYVDKGQKVSNIKIDLPKLGKYTIELGMNVSARNNNFDLVGSLYDEDHTFNYRLMDTNMDSDTNIEEIYALSNNLGHSYYRLSTYSTLPNDRNHVIIVDSEGKSYTFLKDDTVKHIPSDPTKTVVHPNELYTSSSYYALALYASSFDQYSKFYDDTFKRLSKIKELTTHNLSTLESGYNDFLTPTYSWSANLNGRLDDYVNENEFKLINRSGSLDYRFTIPNNLYSKLSIEEPDGNVIALLNSSDLYKDESGKTNVYNILVKEVGLKRAYMGLYHVMLHTITGEKFTIGSVDSYSLKPLLLAHCQLSNRGEKNIPDIYNNVDATISNDLSEIIITLDKSRFAVDKNANVIVIEYDGSDIDNADSTYYHANRAMFPKLPESMSYSTRNYNAVIFPDNPITEEIEIAKMHNNGDYYVMERDVNKGTEWVYTDSRNRYLEVGHNGYGVFENNIESESSIPNLPYTPNRQLIKKLKIKTNYENNTWCLVNEK